MSGNETCKFVLERLEFQGIVTLDSPGTNYSCGRGRNNDIICASMNVSRKHCTFFCTNGKLYVMDLQSSNGLYINGEKQETHKMIPLRNEDIVGIGCPNADPSDGSVFVYKLRVIPPEETKPDCVHNVEDDCKPVVVKTEMDSPVIRKRANTTVNSSIPYKVPKLETTSSIQNNSSSGASVDEMDVTPPQTTENNRNDTKDNIMTDDIEIIDITLFKKEEKNIDYTEHCLEATASTSGQCNGTERLRSTGKEEPLPKNMVQINGQIVKYEEELALIDTDEELNIKLANQSLKDEVSTAPILSPMKLKKVNQEPKSRFSEVDVVNITDDEDDVFPSSQLFDTNFGTDISIKEEIKQEPNDDDISDDRFDRLDNVEEVVLLSGSDDDSNPWLERLSRSQVFTDTEDPPKPIVPKHEIVDFGIATDIGNGLETIVPTRYKESVKASDAGQDLCKEEKPSTSYSSSFPEASFSKEIDTADSTAENGETAQEDSSSPTKLSTSPSPPNAARKRLQKKIPEVEPAPMPTGRRSSSSSGKSKESAEKSASPRLAAKDKTMLKQKEKLDEYTYKKDQKYRRMNNKWVPECLPLGRRKTAVLSKEEKKTLSDNRKARLRELAIEEEAKRQALENRNGKKRIVAKAKAKVSEKNRGDFLTQELTMKPSSKGAAQKSKEPDAAVKKISSNARPNKSACPASSASKTNDQEVPIEVLTTVAFKVGELPHNMKIPKKKATSTITSNAYSIEKEKENQRLNDENTTVPVNPIVYDWCQSDMKGILRSVERSYPRKSVSFSRDLQSVRIYQIDHQNTLRKIVGKDAPIPAEKLPSKINNAVANSIPKLEEFYLRIFSWKPVWLEEQRSLNAIAPVVSDNELTPMLTHYNSYKDYCNITIPLLLLETWCGITKDFDTNNKNIRRFTTVCSIVANSIQITPSPFAIVQLATLLVEVLLTKEQSEKQEHPNYGDLVFFEYTRNVGRQQEFHKVFAYVTQMYPTVLTPATRYNNDLKKHINKPYVLMTYTMLTRPLESDICVNRVQRLRIVTYLRPYIRHFQALQYLPQSALMEPILNPKIELYRLPSRPYPPEQLVTNDTLNPKQLEAVLTVTETIVRKEPKLCFIQGPPGTGKSTVIVNLIAQILYGQNRYQNNNNSACLRLLVCAPSNAAIDEIVLRMLNFRATIKGKRFKMVRIGRPESMHPTVRDISVTELAKRDVRKTAECYASSTIPIASVEEEKSFLQAKINALKCEVYNSTTKDDTYKKHIKMKLANMTAKYDLLTNRKRVAEMTSKESTRLHRAAEVKILEKADIITCTLSSCYTNQMESIFGGNKERISVCIVDEATQSCEAETLIPLMLGINTLVLIGDPNQLPATVISQRAKKFGLDQSIFQRVQNAFEGRPDNPIIQLDAQYRMAYAISYWPNKFFYGGKLKNEVLNPSTWPFNPYRILNLNSTQNDDKFSNTNEAEFVFKIIISIFEYLALGTWSPEQFSIGIITPYQNQRILVQQMLMTDQKILQVPQDQRRRVKIDVNTVDAFQGQERDMIIMSCVRSQGIGFLSDPQRLCVALTRAKNSLLLCGNFNTFMRDTMWNSLLSDAKSRGVYVNIDARAPLSEISTHVIKNTD